VRPPSDKSVGHRALLFGALTNGTTRLRRVALGGDHRSTLGALRALGVAIDEEGEGTERNVVIRGVGLFGLRAPSAPLDCGNSGTTMRLLTGVLAAQEFESTLVGDASLTRRPMMRVVSPLRARGATIEGTPSPRTFRDAFGEVTDVCAPLRIGALGEGDALGPLEYELPVASAQVKSALLLSGLWAHGPTVVREPLVTRDHTERFLLHLGVPIATEGSIVALDPAGWSGQIPPFEMAIPGDLSAAAFLLAAGLLVDGSQVTVRSVGVNRSRAGILDLLRDMGAPIVVEPRGDEAAEPTADVHAHGATGALTAVRVAGEMVARAIDEIPILAVLAACARGTTRIRDAGELRVKESDRVKTTVAMLRAFGIDATEEGDGLTIVGGATPTAAEVDSGGDHRIAMCAAVLGLIARPTAARSATTVRDADCIATSFPRFVGTLRALGATIDVETEGC
jgi:3-phosphoshikimate 1-carboxyvinyltransferase